MKNIIYAILLILGGFSMKWLVNYPAVLTIVATFWCISGALLLYNIIEYILKQTNK